jgi:hypothetical protein
MIVAALSVSANAQTGAVTANGIPVPGATVKATCGELTLTTVTDEQGHYRLTGVPNGPCSLEVEMFRFSTATKQVQVSGPFNTEWALTLKPLTEAKASPPQRNPSGPPPGARSAQNGSAAGGTPPAGSPRRTQQQQQRKAANSAVAQSSQVLELNQMEASQANTPGDASAATNQSDGANEAFLLNGTLSRNLQQVGGDPNEGMGPGFGGPGDLQAGGPGMNQQGGFGGQGGGGFGGPGGGGGFGGPGGGGGGFGGGGRGGGGFGGGGGGFGGRGGQGQYAGRRGYDGGPMGNRRNRGQQSIHGLVNVVLHNGIFNAKPFSLNGDDVPKPGYAQERYSFQIGGPLMIPKLFRLSNTTFNLNYTINRANNLSSLFGTVPTLAERAGDFSALGQTIYNPATGAPFPGNMIPASDISPIAVGLLKYFPLPNETASCTAALTNNCSAQNYQYSRTVPNNNQNLGLRLGQSLGQHDRLAINFQFQDRNSLSPYIYGFLDNTDGLGIATTLSWTHTFANRMFNVASVTFDRNRTDLLPFFADTTDVEAELGILGTSANPLNYGPPNLNFTNYASLTDGAASRVAVQSTTESDAFTIMHGNHRINFGGLYSRAQNNTETDANARGAFTFTGLETSELLNGRPAPNTGNDFADFLLGLPNESTIRYGDTNTYFRANNYSFFGVDDWRMRSNLTINYGLRYEFFGVPYEKYGHEANLDIAPDFTAVAAVVPGAAGPYSGAFPSGLVEPDHNGWAPRIGIAWRPWPKGKTVIRSGYGIYYNAGVYNSFMRNLSGQPPFAVTNTAITGPDNVLTLADGFITNVPGQTILNTWAINKYYRLPYSQTWNFSIQQDLPSRMVLQVSYLGNKGTHLDDQQIPNRALAGSAPIADADAFVYESSDANSSYQALRTNLIRRFSRGVSFNINYVFSKAIDDASTFGGGVAQNGMDIEAERSLSNFDRRHVLNAAWVATSPFGHDSKLMAGHDRVNKVLEDWTLSGSVTAETGLPLDPMVGGNLSNSTGAGVQGVLRPDATGLPVESGSGYFNPLAFTLPPAGQFGNAGRNTIPGPGLVSVNASFGRPFTFGERRSVEFRFDATNVLNQVNITSVGTTVNASNYGLPLAAGAMRSISVTLRLRF